MSLGMEDRSQIKSFWQRPEGTTGMLALAAAGVGLFFAAPALLVFMSTMVSLLGQTIAVVALCIVLAAILFVVTNKRFQTLIGYMFKSVMRKLTGWFVEIDPIGIMKNYIDDLIKKREFLGVNRDKLKGQKTVLEKKIKDNERGFENAMKTAKVAKDQGNNGTFSVNARQAGRLQKLNAESYGPLLAQITIHLRALDKYYEVTGTVIEDMRNEVEAKSEERKLILASHNAIKAARSILSGGGDAKELFDQAMEFVVNDFGMKLGEIESFIENSKGFVDGLDIQNGVYEVEALERLQAWEQKADSVLLGTDKQKMLEHTAVSGTVYTGVGVPAAGGVDYATLLGKR